MVSDLRNFSPKNKQLDSDVPTALAYMDYMGCSGTEVANICTAWQPNYKLSWNGLGITDGYPRFGTGEFGITAGIIEARSSRAVDFQPIMLQGALTLVAGFTSTILTIF